MFKKLLIANRGEIACRIIRTAHELGIQTVAVFSEVDRTALHVRMADEAYLVGPAAARDSYLDQQRILQVIKSSGADALHPGYGFLAENAEFAEAVAATGCRFIGPSAEAIRAMGSKIESKRIVEAAGTPVVPGYQGDDQALSTLHKAAEKTGYPVLIKASAGGGGRGMRLVERAEDFESALQSAKREALAAFDSDLVLIEKYLVGPKHIEVQILADSSGQTRYLFERDCSIQRRHQKVIEEAPAPGVSPQFRQQIGEAAVKAAQAIHYEGAGTVEFIVQGDEFYFMEMNTRLQVEHPVTEAICGMDLVEWQLRVAAGESLPWQQNALQINGHAIEVRIYAENPRKKFLPSTGRLVKTDFPAHVRVDTGVVEGDEVSMHYDPMIAKMIAWAPDRSTAISRLIKALEETRIAGPEHNLGFLDKVLQNPAFRSGAYTTGFIDQHMKELVEPPDSLALVLAALWLTNAPRSASPWSAADVFRLNLAHRETLNFEYLKAQHEVLVEVLAPGSEGCDTNAEGQTPASSARVTVEEVSYVARDVRIEGDTLFALINNAPRIMQVLRREATIYLMDRGRTETVTLQQISADQYDERGIGSGGRILAPMPGQVIAVHVSNGDRVEQDQALMVVEAMKMEHTIVAGQAGSVSAVNYMVGDRVEEGAELVAIE